MSLQKHSFLLRLFHWINVPVLTLLIWSGVLIYWADQAYLLLPNWLVNGANLHHRLAEGMGWHFFLMWLFFFNGLLFLFYTIYSGHWRSLLPRKADVKNFIPFILADLRLKKTPPVVSHTEYNPAQKMAYTSAILMGAGALVTGLAIYKPVQLHWLLALLGGYKAARFEHFLLMIGFIFFIFIHLIQVARAGLANLGRMATAYLTTTVAVLSIGAFFVIQKGPRDNGTSSLFRYSFMANEKVWKILQTNKRMNVGDKVPSGRPPRVNGLIGLKAPLLSSEGYRIEVKEPGKDQFVPLSGIFILPKRSYTSEFRCIEGWSEDTQYAGARFSEFLEAYQLGKKADGSYYPYVGLETPDGKYYVSIDMESMLHPQTLLVWERNYKGLSLNTGFPLRLMIPIKYGIKSLKRIGKITFSDERPRDYWAERGYDWYSGL